MVLNMVLKNLFFVSISIYASFADETYLFHFILINYPVVKANCQG
jgi:hypothetical protein